MSARILALISDSDNGDSAMVSSDAKKFAGLATSYLQQLPRANPAQVELPIRRVKRAFHSALCSGACPVLTALDVHDEGARELDRKGRVGVR